MIRMNNLQFAYGPTFNLDIANLGFDDKSISVIIGPNGSGKSTLLKLMTGLLQANSGSLNIDQSNINKLSEKDIAQNIAYVSTRPEALPEMTVYDVVATGRYPYLGGLGWLDDDNKKHIDDALNATGMTHLKDRHVHSLSSGEAQRTFIARAMAQDTPVVVLDEPVANVDPKYTRTIVKLLQLLKETRIVILVLHDINLAVNLADRLIGMKNGRIEFVVDNGTPVTVNQLSDLFDVPFEEFTQNGRRFIELTY